MFTGSSRMLSQLLHKKSSKESVVRGIEHLYFGHCKGSLLSIIGERAKRARHSQVCSIENRGYILLVSERS